MTITTITPELAYRLVSGTSFWLTDFIDNGDCNDYVAFTHRRTFYSYPEWGKKWLNTDEPCMPHQVDIKCIYCESRPDYNYAGIGTIYMLNNGVGNKEILVQKNGVKSWVPNHRKYSQMIFMCDDHVHGFPWNPVPVVKNKVVQLELF